MMYPVNCERCAGTLPFTETAMVILPDGTHVRLCQDCYDAMTGNDAETRERNALARYDEDQRRKDQKRKQGRTW